MPWVTGTVNGSCTRSVAARGLREASDGDHATSGAALRRFPGPGGPPLRCPGCRCPGRGAAVRTNSERLGLGLGLGLGVGGAAAPALSPAHHQVAAAPPPWIWRALAGRGGLCSLGILPCRRRSCGLRLARRRVSARRWSVGFRFGPGQSCTGHNRREYPAVSTKLVRFSRMAELVLAAEKKEWTKVEVRRPLEAVFSTECGPWRAVRLGLRSVDP